MPPSTPVNPFGPSGRQARKEEKGRRKKEGEAERALGAGFGLDGSFRRGRRVERRSGVWDDLRDGPGRRIRRDSFEIRGAFRSSSGHREVPFGPGSSRRRGRSTLKFRAEGPGRPIRPVAIDPSTRPRPERSNAMLWRHLCLVRAWSAAGLLTCSLFGAATCRPGPSPRSRAPRPTPPRRRRSRSSTPRKAGDLAVEVRGAGQDRVKMTVKNTSARRLKVVLPPGLVASSAAGQGRGFQSMGLGSVSNRAGQLRRVPGRATGADTARLPLGRPSAATSPTRASPSRPASRSS